MRAVFLLFSFVLITTQAQEPSTVIFNNKNQSRIDREIQTSLDNILKSVQEAGQFSFSNVSVESWNSNENIPLSELLEDKDLLETFKTKILEIKEKLSKKDPMNWKHQFNKFLKQLSDDSNSLKDLVVTEQFRICEKEQIDRDTCTKNKLVELNSDKINFWQIKYSRVISIIKDIESDKYLTQAPPSIGAQIEDLFKRL